MKAVLAAALLALGGRAAAVEVSPSGTPSKADFYRFYNDAAKAHASSRLRAAAALFADAARAAAGYGEGTWEEIRATALGGVSLHAMGDLAGAEPLYRKALDLARRKRPGEAYTPVLGLGRIYLHRKDYRKAEPLLIEGEKLAAAESASTPAPYPRADAYSALAQLYEGLGKPDKAWKYYSAALRLHRGEKRGPVFSVLTAELLDPYPVILYRAGRFQESRGKKKEAAELYARALEAFGAWTGLEGRPALLSRLLFYRGKTLKALGRAQEGERDAEEAVRYLEQAKSNE